MEERLRVEQRIIERRTIGIVFNNKKGNKRIEETAIKIIKTGDRLVIVQGVRSSLQIK